MDSLFFYLLLPSLLQKVQEVTISLLVLLRKLKVLSELYLSIYSSCQTFSDICFHSFVDVCCGTGTIGLSLAKVDVKDHITLLTTIAFISTSWEEILRFSRY